MRARGDCAACARACPTDALTLSGSIPVVSDGCLGCGRCAAACPVGAISVKGFGEVAKPICRGTPVYVDCVRAPPQRSGGGVIRVSCLGGLTVSHLLALRLSAGDAPVILLDRGWCSNCPAGAGNASPNDAALTTVCSLLAAISLPEALLPRMQRHLLPLTLRDDRMTRIGISRREFFRRLAANGSVIPERAPTSRGLAKAAPVVRAHMRQMSLLRRLSEVHSGVPVDKLMPRVTISTACRDNGACAAHCPTRALRRWQGKTAQGVSFDPHLCLDCGLCAQSCSYKALSIGHSSVALVIAERLILTAHLLGRCRQCGAEIPGIDTEGHCPRCHNGIGMLRDLSGLRVNHSASGNKTTERGVP